MLTYNQIELTKIKIVKENSRKHKAGRSKCERSKWEVKPFGQGLIHKLENDV